MFGFEWSEIAVIAVVALICIGPKDMPVAIRAITGAIKKMRRMAGEFQTHVDEMLKEADLHEVSDTIRDIRGLNMRNAITRAVDPDGGIGRSLASPFQDRPVPPVTERFVQPRPNVTLTPPPDFLPPGARPPGAWPPGAQQPGAAISLAQKPDFVPPAAAASGPEAAGPHAPVAQAEDL